MHLRGQEESQGSPKVSKMWVLSILKNIETHNNIHTVHSESSGVKLTRFGIERWLELIETPSVNILHRSDCA